MCSYGWTIDQALDGMTLPQARLFASAMGKHPPLPLLAGLLIKGMGEKDKSAEKTLKGLAAATPAGGKQFWKALGIDEEGG